MGRPALVGPGAGDLNAVAQTRYRRLAEALRAEIASGRLAVGALLPSEVELCRAYGVSRHTARDALRLLQQDGLVARRRRTGTTVIAAAPRPAFTQPLGGVDELLQYARDARLEPDIAAVRPLSPGEAQAIGRPVGEPWLVIEGLRRQDGRPLALARLMVAARFAALAPQVAAWEGAVQELIARDFGAQVDRIEQEIAAETLDSAAARRLSADKGAAALRTLRRYFAADGELLLASDTRHPAGRFVYAMTYRRGGGG